VPRRLPALALLLLAPLAQAEALYKCTDAKGAVSIQSEPCARGSTQVWKRDAAPEAGPTPEQLAARAQLAQAQADQAAQAARLAEEQRQAAQAQREAEAKAQAEAAARGTPERKSECTLAHEFNDAVAAKPWLEMTQAQSERIKRWVVDLCRDPDAPVPAEPES
jgi:multidrug efflux pump subunit AcrA (membrane-fusion protein)